MCLTLLHSQRPKLYGILTVLSAKGLIESITMFYYLKVHHIDWIIYIMDINTCTVKPAI